MHGFTNYNWNAHYHATASDYKADNYATTYQWIGQKYSKLTPTMYYHSQVTYTK